jgi:hypothetical protein
LTRELDFGVFDLGHAFNNHPSAIDGFLGVCLIVDLSIRAIDGFSSTWKLFSDPEECF